MKIALVGTGRMGQAVEAVARERGHAVVARFDSGHPFSEDADVHGADVAVDFSTPATALAHLEAYCRRGLPAVVGTTGWYDDRDRVQRWVDEHDGALLYAANFSIGVALLARALRALTPLLDRFDDYDAAIHETHHTGKVDSPSGTALMLADVLLGGLARKTHTEPETQHGRIDPAALHVTSTRLGSVFGQHTVLLDGPFDEIALTHRARNRQGFASGAVRAAEWLPGRHGLLTFDDFLADA